MKQTPFALAAAAALSLSLSLPAFADEQTGQMMSGHSGSMMATMICRPAAAGEKPSPNLVGATERYVCKPLAIAMKGSDGKMHIMGDSAAKPVDAPDYSGLTAMQLNDAYQAWFNKTFSIMPGN